ncbi:MAG TPA: hypothetical protein VFY26_11130, partial [Anaerolineales bacterium]|nr:hypothetical protein [Anaerolineales bacterium]
MRRSILLLRWLAFSTLVACTSQTSTREPEPTVVTDIPATGTAGTESSFDLLPSELGYASLKAPLARRSDEPAAGLTEATNSSFTLTTGTYRLDFGQAAVPEAIMLSRAGAGVAIALRPLGNKLGLLDHVSEISELDDPARPGVRLTGSTGWADFTLWVWVYPHNPGLIRYHLELVRLAELPPGSIEPEWTFVDASSGAEAAGGYEGYADKAAFASPSFFGYVAGLDSTLLHWLDVTRLNPFIEATRFSPGGLPARQGRQFGHNFGR